MKKLFLLATLLFAFASCHKNEADDFSSTLTAGKVIVCHEGGFGKNNASVSVFDPKYDTIGNQAFYGVNDFPLGDVLQSATVVGDRIYFVVNNSATVIVANAHTLKHIGSITGLTSPRYIIEAEGKLYISDLYDTALTIVDPETLKKTGSLELGATSEQMIYRDGFIYACAWSTDNRVFKIDPANSSIVKTITVTDQPNSMRFDANGKLWILSGGKYNTTFWYKETAGALTRVNPETMAIEATLSFPEVDQNPVDLQINGEGKDLFLICSTPWGSSLEGGIFKVGIEATEIPSSPFIVSTSSGLYGMGVDPASGDIYTSDAGFYVEAGKITRHFKDGKVKNTVTADIIPSFFVFM